jgi:hypothetical protein
MHAWALSAFAAPKPATNDASASYENGTFLLPELKSEKDSYVILIKPVGPGEPVTVNVPAGTTGVRVSQKLTLPAVWTWEFKLQADQPPALQLVTSPDLKLLPADVPPTGKVLVQWAAVPGAATYTVSGKSLTPQRADLPAKEDKVDVTCYATSCSSKGVPTVGLAAAPGSDITWRVSALDSDGVVLAKSAEAHITVEQAWTQKAKLAGWTVQQSDTLAKLTATDPAKLTYTSSTKGSSPRTSAYQALFAIIYDSPDAWDDFYFRGSIEGQLTSSGDAKPKDAFKFRAGGYKFIWRNPGKAEGTEWVSNLKYETERKTGTKKAMLEIGLTPIYGLLGKYSGPEGFPVAPTISVGTDLGENIEVGTSEEKKGMVARLRANARLDVELLHLSRTLGFRSISAYVSATAWHLPREDAQRNFRFGATGLSFGLTDYLSFDLAYSAGRQPPLFTFERTGTVGLGVKF